MKDGKGKFFRGLHLDYKTRKIIGNYRKLKDKIDKETDVVYYGQKKEE